MKSKILAILLLTLLFSPVLAHEEEVIAQDDTNENVIELTQEEEDDLFEEERPVEVQDIQALRIDFKQYTQNPRSKVVKFEVTIHSNITSDRVKVTWAISGESRAEDENQLEQVLSVEKGKSYTSSINIIPNGYGVSEVFGKVEAFGVEANTVATARKNYASNDDGEILPLSDQYKSAKTQATIISVISYLLIAVLVIVGGYILLKKVIKWYEKDEVREYGQKFQPKTPLNQ